MNPHHTQRAALLTRRHFLRNCPLGLGAIALAGMTRETPAADVLLPHHVAKAKNVIFLHMSGAPPHLDLFDYKPELVKRNDQPCPDSLLKGKTFAFTSGRAEAARARRRSSPSTARAGRGSRRRCRAWRRSPTT